MTSSHTDQARIVKIRIFASESELDPGVYSVTLIYIEQSRAKLANVAQTRISSISILLAQSE